MRTPVSRPPGLCRRAPQISECRGPERKPVRTHASSSCRRCSAISTVLPRLVLKQGGQLSSLSQLIQGSIIISAWERGPLVWFSRFHLLWSVPRKQKRACFMPLQRDPEQAPTFTLFEMNPPSISAFCPKRGVGEEWGFALTSKHREAAVFLGAGGGRVRQSGRIKATLHFRAFSSLSLCLFSHRMIIPGESSGLWSGPSKARGRMWPELSPAKGGRCCLLPSHPAVISSSYNLPLIPSISEIPNLGGFKD